MLRLFLRRLIGFHWACFLCAWAIGYLHLRPPIPLGKEARRYTSSRRTATPCGKSSLLVNFPSPDNSGPIRRAERPDSAISPSARPRSGVCAP